MKRGFLLTFWMLLLGLFAQAQCDYPNGDLENWQTFPFDIAGETRDIETPVDHVSYNRFLINFLYAEFLGDPVATDLFLNNTQLFWGIEKSTDASSGQYAVKLIAEPNVPFADLYTNYLCNETHDLLKVDVKHVGNTSDTLVINGAFDANLPPLPIGDQAGLDTLAAYYYGFMIADDTTDYVTITLPLLIGDADAPIDSFSLSFFTTAAQGGYFLIDNIRFESASVDEDNDGFTADVDCDDTNPDVNPGAAEVCNGIDDNCDASIDEGVTSTFYADADGDSYGDANSTTDACDAPAGYVTNADDCDDTNDAINPAAAEVCNGIDDNCDASIDEGVTSTFYADADGDSYGDANSTTDACDAPAGNVTNADDCDDMNNAINPDATEACNGIDDNCDGNIDEGVAGTFYADADGDGFGDPATAVDTCDAPAGYVDNGNDCDDANNAINPDATEACNGIDDNCDGNIDEGVAGTFYADADGDGFGDPATAVDTCDAPAGYVDNGNDCDDANNAINPDATEACNGIDDNCDGNIDEGLTSTFYADADGDGFGDPDNSTEACDAPAGYVTNADDCNDADANEYPGQVWFFDLDSDGYGDSSLVVACERPDFGYLSTELIATDLDCDDNNAALNPDALEYCDNIDNNCNGEVDDNVVYLDYYLDLDGDGYGAGAALNECLPPGDEYVTNADDCDDTNNAVNPDATEVCNGIDDNCDGNIDEGVTSTFYADADGDGFGDAATTVDACAAPDGYVDNDDDCDDTNADVNPDAVEVCNGVDDNCDGDIDEGVIKTFYADADNDGYGDATISVDACLAPDGYVVESGDCDNNNVDVNPGATETCNGIDDNCDGNIDEGLLFTYYLDADGDGFGAADMITVACSAPADYVPNADDCDDTNAAVNPGATEVCNTIDDNCDGDINEGLLDNYYLDADGDGYGDIVTSVIACEAPADYVDNSDDCDDTNAAVNPSATEVCNGIDDNCSGQTDEGVTSTFYADADGDGFGVANMTIQACTAPAGYADNDDDCNDASASVNPGVTEVCNGADDNCNGQTDEGVTSTFYLDDDGDGFGDAAASVQDCEAPNDYVSDNTDCDDDDDSIYPGAPEVANNDIDEDCDGEDFISSTDELAELGIKVYPNPFSDRIRLENVPANGYEVKLLNIFGQTMPVLTGNNVELQCSNLPSGTYFVQITEQDTARRKVVRVVKQ